MPQQDQQSLENKLIDLQYIKAERSLNDQILGSITQLKGIDTKLQLNQLSQQEGLQQLGFLNQSLGLQGLGFDIQQQSSDLTSQRSLFELDRKDAFSSLQSRLNIGGLRNQRDQLGVQRDLAISQVEDQIRLGELSLSSIRTKRGALRKSTNISLRQIGSQIDTINKSKDLAARATTLRTKISYLQSESIGSAVEKTRYIRDVNINRNLRKRKASSGLLTSGILQEGFDLEGVAQEARFKLKDLNLEARKVEFSRQAIFNEYSSSLLRSDRQLKDLGFKKEQVNLNYRTQNKIFSNAIKAQKVRQKGLDDKLKATKNIFNLKRDAIDLNIQGQIDRRFLEKGFNSVLRSFVESSSLLSNASINLSRQKSFLGAQSKSAGIFGNIKRGAIEERNLRKSKEQTRLFKRSLETGYQKIRNERLRRAGVST